MADSPFNAWDGYTGPILAVNILSTLQGRNFVEQVTTMTFRKDLACSKTLPNERNVISYKLDSREKDFWWYQHVYLYRGYHKRNTFLNFKDGHLLSASQTSITGKPDYMLPFGRRIKEIDQFKCGIVESSPL